MMNGTGQSDGGIVPQKSPNDPKGKEGAEGRPPVKGNEPPPASRRTQSRKEGMTEALGRIRAAVRKDRKEKLTALFHHIYREEHLRAAYEGLRTDAAPGVDGETWQHYGEELEANLANLSERLARGAYRAKAVRRSYIEKADGRLRPLGIPALEDKIVQEVTRQILSVIWEEEFLGFSYGYRNGKNAHQALNALAVGIQERRVNWVLDADIRGFFDHLSHEKLVEFVRHRIRDERVVELIQGWLEAGVLEDGQLRTNRVGTPQGGLVSPVLANIYLHYVLDLWVQRWRKRQARGEVIIVRYADDFVVGFEDRAEAEQFQAELAERLKQFGLELAQEKTRLIEFGRFAAANRAKRGEGKPETFNFLGFTHVSSTTRNGRFVVKRQTMRKRVQAKLKAVKEGLRRRMNQSIPEQGRWLAAILKGHFQYYGVPFNSPALWQFRHQIRILWKRLLSRRSQKGYVNWERMNRLCRKWLPMPHICHPYPSMQALGKT